MGVVYRAHPDFGFDPIPIQGAFIGENKSPILCIHVYIYMTTVYPSMWMIIRCMHSIPILLFIIYILPLLL